MADIARQRVGAIGIVQRHDQVVHGVAGIEISLRFVERHEDEGLVVQRHADIERAGDAVGLDARRDTERRDVAARRDQRDLHAGDEPHLLGQPRADDDAVPAVVMLERAVGQGLRDDGQRFEVRRAHAAHEHAVGNAARRCHHLAVIGGCRADHARNGHYAFCHRVVVGDVAIIALHHHVAVEAQDAGEQIVAEAVHHRHHDDQRGDAQRDADERNDGDDRDERLFALRPQIAQRDHPLERCEDARFSCHQASRLTAASTLNSSRTPVLRVLISTWPFSRPRGPTMSCTGMPIRSALANFAPGRSAVSS